MWNSGNQETEPTEAGLPDFLSSTFTRMAQNLDELFDVVDESDRVTGQLARREVHRLKLRHRAVHLLVANRAGRVFLHQRSMQKDLFPGVWDSSAAGHVGAGEAYDATAVRELEEEIGCRPAQPPQRLFKVEAREETGQEFVWVYRVEARARSSCSRTRSSGATGSPWRRSTAGWWSDRRSWPRPLPSSGRGRGPSSPLRPASRPVFVPGSRLRAVLRQRTESAKPRQITLGAGP